jgi:hypothetical protein
MCGPLSLHPLPTTSLSKSISHAHCNNSRRLTFELAYTYISIPIHRELMILSLYRYSYTQVFISLERHSIHLGTDMQMYETSRLEYLRSATILMIPSTCFINLLLMQYDRYLVLNVQALVPDPGVCRFKRGQHYSNIKIDVSRELRIRTT